MIDIMVGKLNNNDTDYELLKWTVPDGGDVRAGDVVAVIETSKVAEDIVAEIDGIVVHKVAAGSQIRPGVCIGSIFNNATEQRSFDDEGLVSTAPPIREGKAPFVLTRSAQSLAAARGISDESLGGIGKKVISEADILTLLGEQAAVESQLDAVPPNSIMPSAHQLLVAKTVSYSAQNIPAAFITAKIYCGGAQAYLSSYQKLHATFVGLPELLLEVLGKLHAQYPIFFAQIDGERQLLASLEPNVGVTVDVRNALYIPVVHGLNHKTLADISRALLVIREKAVTSSFKEKDFAGGNLTLSVINQPDILFFTPFILPTQTCMVSLGAGQTEVKKIGEQIEEVPYFILGMSYDHRWINGHDAANFLQEIKNRLEELAPLPVTDPESTVIAASAARNLPALSRYLIRAYQSVLPKLKLEATDLFSELGLNSNAIVSIFMVLKTDFPALSVTHLFEARSVQALAECLSDAFPDVIQEKNLVEATVVAVDTRQPLPSRENVNPVNSRLSHANEDLNLAKNGVAKGEDIAIIGMNGIFPGAKNCSEFWELLKRSACSITPYPEERKAMIDPTLPKEEFAGIHGGFLSNIDAFDAKFFGISPHDAQAMDPQQRLFLQVVWGLMEDAGYTPDRLDRNMGVFLGLISNDYSLLAAQSTIATKDLPRYADGYQIANRVSYVLDLHGPSMAIDTACSASGTALHVACESIRHGDCNSAIVGGVNLLLHPSRFQQYSYMNMLSPSNQCSPFGAAADGTVLGEGIAAVMLKSLSQAEEDGDHIYGVIKGSAINSGGHTNGFTVPNPAAHKALISNAIRNSQVTAESISYVEAHGTGTSLGDPIEIQGLQQAFERESQSKLTSAACALGSVKSNIGHLESCAALSGLIKILLQFKHKKLVPSLHSESLNPLIPFAYSHFYVQQTLSSWSAHPRRAGISSFGAGGSNAHIVLEEYTKQPSAALADSERPLLFIFSAKSHTSLKNQVLAMADYLDSEDAQAASIVDIAYTLQTARLEMKVRFSVVERSKAGLRKALRKSLAVWEESDSQGVLCTPRKQSAEQAAKIADLIRLGDLNGLCQQWMTGHVIPWEGLYDNAVAARRISLPSYVFDTQRYWVSFDGREQVGQVWLHPLLHSNTSDLESFKFTSQLAKDLISDTAYLEMAVQAVKQLTGRLAGFRCEAIFWADGQSVLPDQTTIFVGLVKAGVNQLNYDIYTESESDLEHVVLHQGNIDYSPLKAQTWDVGSWKKGLARAIPSNGEAIRSLWESDGAICGELNAATSGVDMLSGYCIQPHVLSTVLSCLGLFQETHALTRIALLSLKEMRVYAPFRPLMHFQLIRNAESFDVYLASDQGDAILFLDSLVIGGVFGVPL
jgi:3-oxoacyl-(acyl-carrier-protein) synthase/pyruvate/2-oxoglutarate dehydrogenase complex dihydrolipoamide acyltransferase (E2) component